MADGPINNIPLSLYIHFPWCVKKCPYCDFNSHAAGDISHNINALPQERYLDALLRDLAEELVFVQGRKIHSIFFGGGTPSLMSPMVVEKLLETIKTSIGFQSNIEITLEANPGATEQRRFSDYRSAGVNRISIGAQTFNNIQLQTLGRIHSTGDIFSAIDVLRSAGFENFNIDLMFALPKQTQQQAIEDLQQAIDLKPTHLSWYQLTIEPNTSFYNQQPVLPDDDLQYEMMKAGHLLLSEHGYQQYETSAFSQSGKQCMHNRNYWEFGDYIGIGAGAHGKLTAINEKNLTVCRRQKTRVPEHYMRSVSPCSSHIMIDGADFPVEFALNSLRLIDGVQRSFFAERTGLPFSVIDPLVQQLIQEGLLRDDASQLAPTTKGALFLNDVVSRFIGV